MQPRPRRRIRRRWIDRDCNDERNQISGKVRRVLSQYEEQTEEDALLEDDAGVESSETVMNVPDDLVPKVRELIAKRQS